METKTEMVAAFPATGNWQATRRDNQYADNMIQLRATRMIYAVVSEHGSWHHGFMTEQRAATFARSLHHTAIVMEVEPYWYCTGWGRVCDDAVYTYDAEDHTEWKKKRSPSQHCYALGTDPTSAGMRPVRVVSRGH